MLLIILAVVVGLFLIASFCPIWNIKWKYIDPSRATVDPSGNIDNVPKGWMLGEANGMMLWHVLFGTTTAGKSLQSYTLIYSRGENIRYKIAISI